MTVCGDLYIFLKKLSFDFFISKLTMWTSFKKKKFKKKEEERNINLVILIKSKSIFFGKNRYLWDNSQISP